jgi:hypothetical protein
MRGTVDKLCPDVANEKKISGIRKIRKGTLSVFVLIGSQKHTLKGPDKLRGYGRFGKVPFHFVCLSAVDCAEKKLLKLSTFRTVVPIVFQLEGLAPTAESAFFSPWHQANVACRSTSAPPRPGIGASKTLERDDLHPALCPKLSRVWGGANLASWWHVGGTLVARWWHGRETRLVCRFCSCRSRSG